METSLTLHDEHFEIRITSYFDRFDNTTKERITIDGPSAFLRSADALKAICDRLQECHVMTLNRLLDSKEVF